MTTYTLPLVRRTPPPAQPADVDYTAPVPPGRAYYRVHPADLERGPQMPPSTRVRAVVEEPVHDRHTLPWALPEVHRPFVVVGTVAAVGCALVASRGLDGVTAFVTLGTAYAGVWWDAWRPVGWFS